MDVVRDWNSPDRLSNVIPHSISVNLVTSLLTRFHDCRAARRIQLGSFRKLQWDDLLMLFVVVCNYSQRVTMSEDLSDLFR